METEKDLIIDLILKIEYRFTYWFIRTHHREIDYDFVQKDKYFERAEKLRKYPKWKLWRLLGKLV